MSGHRNCYLRELAELLKSGNNDVKTSVMVKHIRGIKYSVEDFTEYKIRQLCEKYIHRNQDVQALRKRTLELEKAQLREISQKIKEQKDQPADKNTIKTLKRYINRKDGWLHTATDYLHQLNLTDKQIDDHMLEDLLLTACRCEKCRKLPRLGEKEVPKSEEDIEILNKWLKLFNQQLGAQNMQPGLFKGKMTSDKKTSLRFDPIGRTRR